MPSLPAFRQELRGLVTPPKWYSNTLPGALPLPSAASPPGPRPRFLQKPFGPLQTFQPPVAKNRAPSLKSRLSSLCLRQISIDFCKSISDHYRAFKPPLQKSRASTSSVHTSIPFSHLHLREEAGKDGSSCTLPGWSPSLPSGRSFEGW